MLTEREVRFPVAPSRVTLHADDALLEPAIEYYVLIFDDARQVVRHPTLGREVSCQVYHEDVEAAHRWLRGGEW